MTDNGSAPNAEDNERDRMINGTATVTLTAEDIMAMKTADSVSFHVNGGKAAIRCHLDDALNERIFTAKQQRLFPPNNGGYGRAREITPVGWSLTSYDKELPTARYNFDENLRPRVRAFAWISSARYSHRWLTITELVRVGDSLTLLFTADNGTESTRGVGFVRDTFDLQVKRPSRKHAYPMTFRLNDYCGPRNTARMVHAD